MKFSMRREKALDDARKYSPISLVLAVHKLPQTVLARLVCFPVVWIICGVYLAIALPTRYGMIDLAEPVAAAFEGASVGASVAASYDP